MEAVIPTHLIPTPGPRGWPLVGSLFDLARDPLDFLARMPREHGDVVHYHIGPQQVWLVSHPAGIEQVLLELKDRTHKDEITHGLSRLLGQGLLTSEDPLWKRQRKLAAPSFQPRHLAAYADEMVQAAARAVTGLPAGSRDLHADMTAVTLDIVLRTLFGSASADAGRQVGASIDSFMHAFERELRSWQRMLPQWVPTPDRWRITRARKTIEAVLDEVLTARRAEGTESDDLLGRLLAARDEDGNPMSDAQLKDEAVTLFLAGHETTALTLSYALRLLALHPQVQETVRAEVREVAGDEPLTMGAVQRLRWTGAVIDEAMRLFPPAWLIGRTPIEDVVVQGHPIPKGAQILLPTWVAHRDARWWRDPEAFRPDRWLGDEVKDLPRFAYFPFGGGPRVCIGNHFARMESVLVLATWVRALRLRPTPGATLELMPAVTLRPRTGVWLDVEPA